MAAAVHPSTVPDAGHRNDQNEPVGLFDDERYRKTFEKQTAVTVQEFKTAYVERLESSKDANGVITDTKGFGCLADAGDESRDVVVLRLRLLAWMTKNELPEGKQTDVIEALKKEIAAMNDSKSKHHNVNLTIPDPVIDEVFSFFNANGELTMNYYDAGDRPGQWIKRTTPDILRNDRGESEDGPHIEKQDEDGMDVDSRPDFIVDICNKNGATNLLRAVFEDPTNKQKVEVFSSAIDEDIRKAASERGLTTDFTLHPAVVRGFFMQYVRAGYLAKAEKFRKDALAQQRTCKEAWSSEVKERGYPLGWQELFTSIGDKRVEKGDVPFTNVDIERVWADHKGTVIMSKHTEAITNDMHEKIKQLGEAAERANPTNKASPQQSADGSGATDSEAKQPSKEPGVVPESTTKSKPADRPGFGSFASPPDTITYLGQERKIEGIFVSAWSVKPTKKDPKGVPRTSQFLVRVTAEDNIHPIWHLIGTRGYGSNAVENYTAAGGQIVIKGTSDDVGDCSLEKFKPMGIAAVPSKTVCYPMRNSNMMIKGCFEDKPDEVRYYFRTTLGNKFGQKKIDDEVVKWYAKANILCPLITKEERVKNKKIKSYYESKDSIPINEESDDEVELEPNDGKYTSDDGFVQPDHEAETGMAGKIKEPVEKAKTGTSGPKQDAQPQLDIPTGLMDTKQLQWLLEQLKASTQIPKTTT